MERGGRAGESLQLINPSPIGVDPLAAQMEIGHYNLIAETIEMLADPAAWQFKQVRPVQEG